MVCQSRPGSSANSVTGNSALMTPSAPDSARAAQRLGLAHLRNRAHQMSHEAQPKDDIYGALKELYVMLSQAKRRPDDVELRALFQAWADELREAPEAPAPKKDSDV